MSFSVFWNELIYQLFTQCSYPHFSWFLCCVEIIRKFSFNFYICYIEKCSVFISPNLSSKFFTCTPKICIYLALGFMMVRNVIAALTLFFNVLTRKLYFCNALLTTFLSSCPKLSRTIYKSIKKCSLTWRIIRFKF